MGLFSDTYDQMLEDINTLTKRPDLSDEAALALRAATLSVHMSGRFPRDVSTELVNILTPAYLTSINAPNTLPRLRGLVTVRIVDVNNAPLETPRIKIVELGDIYDPEYNTIKQDIAYIAGTSVNINTSVAAYGYLIEFLQLPQTRRDSYNSWVAQLAPDIIVLQAASIVLRTNGNEEKAKSFDATIEKILQPQLEASFLLSAAN